MYIVSSVYGQQQSMYIGLLVNSQFTLQQEEIRHPPINSYKLVCTAGYLNDETAVNYAERRHPT